MKWLLILSDPIDSMEDIYVFIVLDKINDTIENIVVEKRGDFNDSMVTQLTLPKVDVST